MKIEVFRGSDDKPTSTYEIRQLSMADFQGWPDLSQVEMPLTKLSATIEKLQPADKDFTTTNMPIDPYLPLPAKEDLAQRESEAEQLLQPPVSLAVAMVAIVQEVLHTHQPNEEYRVRISE